MSKGSKRRPAIVDIKTYNKNYELAFGTHSSNHKHGNEHQHVRDRMLLHPPLKDVHKGQGEL